MSKPRKYKKSYQRISDASGYVRPRKMDDGKPMRSACPFCYNVLSKNEITIHQNFKQCRLCGNYYEKPVTLSRKATLRDADERF